MCLQEKTQKESKKTEASASKPENNNDDEEDDKEDENDDDEESGGDDDDNYDEEVDEDEFSSGDEEVLKKAGVCRQSEHSLLLFSMNRVDISSSFFSYRHFERKTEERQEENSRNCEYGWVLLSCCCCLWCELIFLCVCDVLELCSVLYSCSLFQPEAFFEDASQYDENLTFQDMNLSRPLLKVSLTSHAFEFFVLFIFCS